MKEMKDEIKRLKWVEKVARDFIDKTEKCSGWPNICDPNAKAYRELLDAVTISNRQAGEDKQNDSTAAS